MLCDANTDIDWHGSLDAGHILILGEMHGTSEIPAFAASAVCDALRRGHPVCLFVEWPASLQDRLTVPGELLADPFFTGAFQDGRRSGAMAGLVARVESWHLAGAPVDVVAMDPVDGDRNAGMAVAVRNWMDAHADSVGVVLVGNIHARLTPGWRNDPSYQPMGLLLSDFGDRLRSLNAKYGNGAAWNCQPDCGVHPLQGEDAGPAPSVSWSPTRANYDGWYYVGAPTPSAPAAAAQPSRTPVQKP